MGRFSWWTVQLVRVRVRVRVGVRVERCGLG